MTRDREIILNQPHDLSDYDLARISFKNFERLAITFMTIFVRD